MKIKSIALVAGLSLLTACGGGGEPEVTDPYADLPEGTLLVRFEANPELEDGQCNPNVHYALRTDQEFILLNANYEVVNQSLTGSGASLVNEDASGVATTTIELNMFDPYPAPCSELEVRAQDLKCRTEFDDDTNLCPAQLYEGTEIFATFRELPTY